MDNNTIATLKDYQATIEKSIGRIKSTIEKFDSYESSQQDITLRTLQDEMRTFKTCNDLMKIEVPRLKSELNQKTWTDIHTRFQADYDKYKAILNEKLNKKKKEQLLLGDIQPDIIIDPKKMTVQHAFDHGDRVLLEDRKAIDRMGRVVNNDVDIMKEANKEMQKNEGQLENAGKDLKEIDYSLKRAGEQLKTMFRMYATDKIILGMIVIIVLVIIAIMITALVGGDSGGKLNVPHDIFSSNGSNTHTNSSRLL